MQWTACTLKYVLKYIYTPEIITKIEVMNKSIATTCLTCLCAVIFAAFVLFFFFYWSQGLSHSRHTCCHKVIPPDPGKHLSSSCLTLNHCPIQEPTYSFWFIFIFYSFKLMYAYMQFALVWLLSFSILVFRFIHVILWVHISFIWCGRSLYSERL